MFLSSVLKLIVQESRPVFLALEQNPTPPHGDCTETLLQWCLVFPTELRGKTLKLLRRRGQASGNCKTLVSTASHTDHKCELVLFTPVYVLFQLQSPVQFLQFLHVQQHSERFTVQRQVQTHPASWKRATPSPSSQEKSPKRSTSSKRSNSSFQPCQNIFLCVHYLQTNTATKMSLKSETDYI